jgi:hypothetical protein
MTMPNERTYAVCRARDFLRRLASPYAGGIKGIRRDIREEARRILRHYPAWFDLSRADAFDEAAAIRYGEQETGEDWLREMGKPITKPMPKRKRA